MFLQHDVPSLTFSLPFVQSGAWLVGGCGSRLSRTPAVLTVPSYTHLPCGFSCHILLVLACAGPLAGDRVDETTVVSRGPGRAIPHPIDPDVVDFVPDVASCLRWRCLRRSSHSFGHNCLLHL